MFDHPQVVAEDMIAPMTHPALGQYRGLSRSIQFGRTPGPVPFAAPTMGQHTDDLLDELGLDAREIERLRRSGAVR